MFFKGLPFTVITLLSSKHFGSPLLNKKGKGGGKLMLNSIFCMELSSRYRRDVLCIDIIALAASSTVFHLLNVHLDSFDSYF